MKRRRHLLILPLTLLLLAVVISPFWNEKRTSTGQAQPILTARPEDAAIPRARLSLNNYIERLSLNGCAPDLQAVLLQTLDGRILAQYNIDTPLNPASVMKLATSYITLKHYGPDHRFRTIAYTNGRIDESKQVLYGDLVIEAEGDPHFTLESAAILAASIRSQGIKRVEGELIFKGPFRFFHRWSTEYAQAKMRAALGLTFPKPVKDVATIEKEVRESEERVLLGVHSSRPLRELLLYMNAHSDNFYADQLGEALGGPSVVQQELQAEFKLQPYELQIGHTSGLDYNRITLRASLAIQKKMIQLLAKHHMKIEDIVPVAGVDSGTLATRFRSEGMRGAIVGKTGTLNVTDNGVSALQGVIYTKRFGPVMYALFNMGGSVNYFRKLQDEFLKEALDELETELTPIRTENIFGEEQVEVPKLRVKKVAKRHRR